MGSGIEVGTAAWYVLLLMAGVAVGVAVAIVQKIFRDR